MRYCDVRKVPLESSINPEKAVESGQSGPVAPDSTALYDLDE